MVVLEFLEHVVVSILIGYLAFTNMLADGINTFLGVEDLEKAYIETVPETDGTHDSMSLSAIPSRYELGGKIPKILLENAQYQQAAVGASDQEDSVHTSSTQTVAERVESAIVNIYCEFVTETYKRTTTGTGFFIHESGVVLTNAHVAQFLLLTENEHASNKAECTLRTGNPAVATYTAELLYISPAWISEHANLINEAAPRGTGERDYALLYVAKGVDNNPLPRSFPALPINTESLSRSAEGAEIHTAGYPTETLRSNGNNDLKPVVATSSVIELYTFGGNTADIFSIADSPVGESGSSGGPIVNESSMAIGLITTKGNPETEGMRSLRALTLAYIDRTIKEETGYTLLENMRGDLAFRGRIFNQALAPFLTRILEREL